MQQRLLYLDPECPRRSMPPGMGDPGYAEAYVEARMLLKAASAGASRRVLARLVKQLSPLGRAILRWMVAEIRGSKQSCSAQHGLAVFGGAADTVDQL